VAGFFKGLILFVPVLLMHFIACTFISILYLPHDIFYSYYTILGTKKLGRNIKVLAILLLPLPLVLWPPAVLFVSILVGLYIGLFYPVYFTLEEEKLVLGGWIKTFEITFKNIKWFYKFDTNSYFTYLEEFRNAECTDPFDIRIIDIFVGIIIASIGVVIDGVAITLIAILKFPLSFPKAYYTLWKAYFELDCIYIFMLFIFFVIGNALVPVALALTLGVVIIAGFCVGLGSAAIAYKNGLAAAFKWQINVIYKFDDSTNDILFKVNSCLPCCKFNEV